MAVRKNFKDLSGDERDAFLEALLLLKMTPGRPPASGAAPVSVYDQFVALHGAVMTVQVPGHGSSINMGHRAPGFLPWHRQYIVLFERALDSVKPGVALPYWDWTEHDATRDVLFQADFLGPMRSQSQPYLVDSGFFSAEPPASGERPNWWPPEFEGWRLDPRLNPFASELPDQFDQYLIRGGNTRNGGVVSELATRETVDTMLGLDEYLDFWLYLEAGSGPPRGRAPTHNFCHNWVGGHMASSVSPNDPIFFLHHCFVDKLWAEWQSDGHGGVDHFPDRDPPGERIPPGHKLDDLMWPWVADEPGYGSNNNVYQEMIPDYSAEPPARPRDMLDHTVLGYSYE